VIALLLEKNKVSKVEKKEEKHILYLERVHQVIALVYIFFEKAAQR